MKLIHNPGSAHWYRADGATAHDADLRQARKEGLLFSVTSILKAWPKDHLSNWKVDQAILKAMTMAKNEGEEDKAFAQRVVNSMDADLEAAAAWGRTIHWLFEQYALHQKFPDGVGETFVPYCAEIEKWFSDNVKNVLFAEEILVNEEFGYAGTCDLKAEMNGDLGIVYADFKRRPWWKSGAALYDTDPAQLIAYAKADKAAKGEFRIASVAINRDKPEIHTEVWNDKKHDDYWARFMACYHLTCVVKNYTPPCQRLLDGKWIVVAAPQPVKQKQVRKKNPKPKKHPELPMETTTSTTTAPYEDIIP